MKPDNKQESTGGEVPACTLTPEDALLRFGTDAARGLTDAQIAENREKFGENAFSKHKKVTVFRRIWNAVKEPMLIMLLFAALITLGVNIAQAATGGHADWLECVGIFAAIALSAAITVVMEGRSAKAFETLNRITEDVKVKVIRNGSAQLVSRKELVAGDILCVSVGDKLAADARLIESKGLASDESALTGETFPVKKEPSAVFGAETPVAERKNMLYSGTFVTAGSGNAVVTSVGDHTEFGKIAQALASSDEKATPLQEKMAKLGKRITVLGAIAAALVFIIQIVLFFVRNTISVDSVSEAFITSIVLIVAAVPEGLPTIVAVSLAVNVIKMSKENALVKKMIACETIGCINVICSDKTGTLTENRMTVREVCSNGRVCLPGEISERVLLENFCVNGTADIRKEKNKLEFIGNPTECALLAAAEKSGANYLNLRREAEIAHVYSFSSETKNMTTVTKASSGDLLVYTKGSPEKILSMCPLPESDKKEIETRISELQSQSCRLIGFAHKVLSGEFLPRDGENASEYFEQKRAEVECEMVFDGFAAITDPLRADVKESVEKCRSAGIDVKMLTGDHLVTAAAIAGELGLLDDSHIAVEAREIENMTDDELNAKLPSIRVIARSTPSVKMRVVNALKSLGNVVAVTGDGINDAPAIKSADVGIAMGISGTEVSKEASDVVLLDDSFTTIVKSVQWGRGIYENFQRFIQFQLTVNLSSVIVVFLSIVTGFAAPFSALELLWINIIMDGPPALTLGLEPMRRDLMKERPTSRNASIVSKQMLSRILVNGLYISAVFMVQHFTNFLGGTAQQLPTILFTMFVVMQLFNAFNSRELGNESVFRSLGRNKLMLVVFALTFGLQVIITQFGGPMFGTVPLPFVLWLEIVALGFSVVLVSELAKLLRKLSAKIKSSIK